MVDITLKNYSLRKAIAQSLVTVSKQETIELIRSNQIPKGNIFEMSKVAGLFGIKRTSDLIPDCHPLPVEFSSIKGSIDGLSIVIEVEVHTIYKTGVEVEAMTGASIAALTIYDMLKPVDKGVIIEKTFLVEKKGGKSDFQKDIDSSLKAAVVVCSDTISGGSKEDKAGKAIIRHLERNKVKVADYFIIPDDPNEIASLVHQMNDAGCNMLFFTGGTGLSRRDVTPDVVKPLLTREIPGIMEMIRSYGQHRSPYSFLSRGVSGMVNDMLVITLPGSTKGADESMHAIMPHILHLFKVIDGGGHEGGY
ncbi:MAG: bifunctional molybdenum cofactor biosynthesis protein MoaC/MoaB [Saprospiraceae bacterium]|nr:bifunctional molybdenum cofactor biosynthesis protein MoaC/MoaB [Saprospiraceae bacterium]MBX7093761.1 bifunctional molybdenum cofactor biosynthesis protein MoaC/MoaB [Flavobacteriales bacterium]